jgi:acyl-CoA dehydrogenase
MNSQLPEEYDGAGASYVDGAVIGEELAWGCAIGTTLGTNELATPVLFSGSERIKVKIARHAHRGAQARLALSHETRGPARMWRPCAPPPCAKGDKYVLNGSKVFITNGGYANWYTVYAKTDEDAGHRGISAFLVPRDDTVTVDKHEDKMGLRASNTAAISFNETEMPGEHLLGDENHGFKLAMMPWTAPAPASRRWRPASPSQTQRLVIAREILLPRQIEEPAVERPLTIAA